MPYPILSWYHGSMCIWVRHHAAIPPRSPHGLCSQAERNLLQSVIEMFVDNTLPQGNYQMTEEQVTLSHCV